MRLMENLKVKIFADGADQKSILALSKDPLIKGFTTNPSLMRKDGVKDYEKFCKTLLEQIPNHPISFEVFADDLETMEAQARTIASWGSNVYVKIPVTNTKKQFTGSLIKHLSAEGVALNITALLTTDQVRQVAEVLDARAPAVISVFAGRIADTGVDPEPILRACNELLKNKPKAELLWASTRELFNIFQAERVGCHIITVTHDMLKKLNLIGKNLETYSLETVEMFYKDAVAAGFAIHTEEELVTV